MNPPRRHAVLDRRELDRRKFLQRLAAAGLLAVPGAGVLSACATGGGGGTTAVQGEVSADNPLGVAPDAPLDVVIFKGGYGDEYAKFHESLYQREYPNATISHTATTQISQEMQPRFVAGNPPDVLDDSGAQKIPYATLVAEDQLTDLAKLLDAPSFDDRGVPVRDTLLPGVIEQGTFDDRFLILNYVYAAYPMWYSKPLFEKNGWQPPATWDEMLALCEQIKAAGIAPWAYGGVNAADYVLDLNLGMAAKLGGLEVLANIDNLEPNAWTQDAVVAGTEAVEELVRKGYFLPGCEGLKHTEAQTAWVQGEAAFYVSGSWIENEMKGIAPPDFTMTAAPVPVLDTGGAMPLEAMHTLPTEAFLVPKQAKNVNGGLEYLRLMLVERGRVEVRGDHGVGAGGTGRGERGGEEDARAGVGVGRPRRGGRQRLPLADRHLVRHVPSPVQEGDGQPAVGPDRHEGLPRGDAGRVRPDRRRRRHPQVPALSPSCATASTGSSRASWSSRSRCTSCSSCPRTCRRSTSR
jgi:N-acetylglucosamine transport system substrate-binding protein